MEKPADVLMIDVEYDTEDEDSGPVYIASNRLLHLVAEAPTFEALLETLPDAIAVCLEDTDTLARYNLVPNPRIEIHLKTL